jgi:uncharacterized membrane protein YoaK (UPF0700 family)
MGIQNSTARRLGVPDLTTTVLTMTSTGLAADVRRSGPATIVRRMLAVVTMFGGAAIGATIVLHAHPAWALAVVVALLAIVTIDAALASRRVSAWQHS